MKNNAVTDYYFLKKDFYINVLEVLNDRQNRMY